jgi:hypothetical protein
VTSLASTNPAIDHTHREAAQADKPARQADPQSRRLCAPDEQEFRSSQFSHVPMLPAERMGVD